MIHNCLRVHLRFERHEKVPLATVVKLLLLGRLLVHSLLDSDQLCRRVSVHCERFVHQNGSLGAHKE